MSLRIKHLNEDSSFLLIFSPAYAPYDPQGTFPGSFTILVDPWLSGPSIVGTPKFAHTTLVIPSCLETIAELPDPDLVIISQDKPDHCHQETLRRLPPDTAAIILGTPGAAKKIRGWRHFDASRVCSLRRYNGRNEEAIYRIPIPPVSASGLPGEVTVSYLASKVDLKGLHNAIGITYRPPSSVLSAKTASYLSLPLTPPDTPRSDSTKVSASNDFIAYHAPIKERALSLIYSPHGVDYSLIKPWATSHLMAEAALPLTALLHSFNVSTNPWYMGGNICAGAAGGLEIVQNLCAKAWISAHDEDKKNTGLSVRGLKIIKYDAEAIMSMLEASKGGSGAGFGKSHLNTDVVALEAGQEYFTKGC